MIREALVTGDAGFVGQHFFRRLEEDGYRVWGADLANKVDCRTWFRVGPRVDLVIHCAATVGGRLNIDGNPLAIAENFALDSELFQYVHNTGVGQTVYFSSSAAYPIDLQKPPFQRELCEADMDGTKPDSTYGVTKVIGEYQAMLARQAGHNVYIVRPFSGYGPGQSLDYPFPSFVDRIKRGVDTFDIWGDGDQVRDFIHIDDIVEAVMVMLRDDVPGPVNLGTGLGTSFNQLARQMIERYSPGAHLRHLGDKPVGVRYRVADTMRLNTFYTPKVSLEEGITRAFA